MDHLYNKNKRLVILKYLNYIFLKKSEMKPKILSKIDYYSFITENIINDNNNSLSNFCINFIIEVYNNSMT